jgi:hypothetical protein
MLAGVEVAPAERRKLDSLLEISAAVGGVEDCRIVFRKIIPSLNRFGNFDLLKLLSLLVEPRRIKADGKLFLVLGPLVVAGAMSASDVTLLCLFET